MQVYVFSSPNASVVCSCMMAAGSVGLSTLGYKATMYIKPNDGFCPAVVVPLITLLAM